MTILNWYKLAQSKSKSLAEMLQSLQDDSDVDPNTLDWVRSLPDREASVVIRNLLSNPSIPLDRLKGFVSRSQRDRAKYQESFNPLTPDMETYVSNQGELADWLRYNLLSRKGEAREKLFQHIEENVDFVRDWYNMGFRDDPESRPKLDGNLPFERAVLLSERWHDRQVRSGSTEYEPTDPRNIIKKYPNGWTWQKITSENDAIAEGNIMDHCLRFPGHCEAIRLGKEIPYSLRDENNKPKVTTTFKYQHVLLDEAKGYKNADPAPHMDYLKDLFAIFKPRYSKENYLSGKLDELGMKDLTRLKAEDVEADPFLQKVVNNAIIRGDEIFPAAQEWARKILESSKVPDEWIRGIGKHIQQYGDAPSFAYYWAIDQLDSGQAPQWFIDAVSEHLTTYGKLPNFATDWARKQMKSGQLPQWLIDDVDGLIKNRGWAPLDFAEEWAKKQMDLGQAPQEWTKGISAFIQQNGWAPGFAKNWAKEKLDSGQAPQEWIDAVNKHIQKYGGAPDFATDWAKKTIDSGQAPQEWIEGISKYIQENGRAPHFARDWAKNKLESGQAPQELIDAVNEFIKMKWYTPDFAKDWAKKILESGQAPQEWIEGISKYIQKIGYAPPFAQDWTIGQLELGQPPQMLIDVVNEFIQITGNPPGFARDWVKNKLDSGQAPQWLIDAVSKKNKKN